MKYFFLFLLLCASLSGWGCTSGLVTGRHTSDGRPLLLKQRDSEDYYCHVDRVEGNGIISFIGIFNNKDVKNRQPLCGMNENGLCVISTATYNLGDRHIQNGISSPRVMYAVLTTCNTTKDFEAYLTKIQNSDSLVPSNYGVIDAKGNCCYYEVEYKKWVKYDVNDKRVAPKGYMVVTNYSQAGDSEKKWGIARKATADSLIRSALSQKQKIDEFWILNNVCRSYDKTGKSNNTTFIANNTTTFAAIFKGMVPDKSPKPEMWVALGYPLSVPVVPVSFNEDIPHILKFDSQKKSSLAPLNRFFEKLHNRLAVVNPLEEKFAVRYANAQLPLFRHLFYKRYIKKVSALL